MERELNIKNTKKKNPTSKRHYEIHNNMYVNKHCKKKKLKMNLSNQLKIYFKKG